MLELDPTRDGPPPKDAATLVLLRPREGGEGGSGFEIFCVERNKKSRFLGGAIVFPGGRLEESDHGEAWRDLTTEPRAGVSRGHGVAACRETLEEAALLLVDRPTADADVLALRGRQAADAGALGAFLAERGMRLDLGALHPLSRWITPKVEPRRYDTRFFLAIAPAGQTGAHDMSETMASFWATPQAILERFARCEIQLAPPTHRTIALLAEHATIADALGATLQPSNANGTTLEPICPELVQQAAAGDGSAATLALVLPGDPAHSVREPRIAGPSRYVLRGEHWRAERAP